MTRPIYMLGDIHGDYAGLLEILDERKIRDAVVIHVGDGHEGFPECGLPVLETLNQEFATRGIEYLSIRGKPTHKRVGCGEKNSCARGGWIARSLPDARCAPSHGAGVGQETGVSNEPTPLPTNPNHPAMKELPNRRGFR